MRIILLAIALFLNGCALLTIDYSDYPVKVGPGKVNVYDLSKGAKKTAEIYFNSTEYKGSLGGMTRELIVQTELDGVPTPKPKDKGRVVEGIQASKLSAGVHSLKFRWIAAAYGGFKVALPYSLVSFNFKPGKRYIVKGKGNKYWIEDLDTGKVIDADIQRGV